MPACDLRPRSAGESAQPVLEFHELARPWHHWHHVVHAHQFRFSGTLGVEFLSCRTRTHPSFSERHGAASMAAHVLVNCKGGVDPTLDGLEVIAFESQAHQLRSPETLDDPSQLVAIANVGFYDSGT
jgi:hypothetical protein